MFGYDDDYDDDDGGDDDYNDDDDHNDDDDDDNDDRTVHACVSFSRVPQKLFVCHNFLVPLIHLRLSLNI